MSIEISQTKRILAHHGISVEKLFSKDEEIRDKEVEKFVHYLSEVHHMSPEEIDNYFATLKIEFMNLMLNEDE